MYGFDGEVKAKYSNNNNNNNNGNDNTNGHILAELFAQIFCHLPLGCVVSGDVLKNHNSMSTDRNNGNNNNNNNDIHNDINNGEKEESNGTNSNNNNNNDNNDTVKRKRILIVHGGLFRRPGVLLRDLQALNRVSEPPEEGDMCDLLWSDPMHEQGIHNNNNNNNNNK